MTSIATNTQHTYFDDAQAIFIGTLLVALGVTLYSSAGLLTGGTAGLAFLAQYTTQFSFGQMFFVINLPFYILAVREMGWEFTIKTFISVLLVSLFSEFTPLLIDFNSLNIVYASIVGGFLMGSGFLMLFRHNASLGGLNILAKYMAKKYNISMGKFQMAVDFVIVLLAIFVVDWAMIATSLLGAIALNIIIAVNHKPGRYNVV
jgi:uncharacterized membrane-anchored protein YitT (DUF2179 family)